MNHKKLLCYLRIIIMTCLLLSRTLKIMNNSSCINIRNRLSLSLSLFFFSPHTTSIRRKSQNFLISTYGLQSRVIPTSNGFEPVPITMLKVCFSLDYEQCTISYNYVLQLFKKVWFKKTKMNCMWFYLDFY